MKQKHISLMFLKKVRSLVCGTPLNTVDLVPVVAHQHRHFPSHTTRKLDGEQQPSAAGGSGPGVPLMTCQKRAALLPGANVVILTNG